jgi:large subunit ribosomal protein L25
MQKFTIEAQVRSGSGKGDARKLRSTGRVPAVVYAKDKEAFSVDIDPRDLTKAMHSEYRRNTLIDLKTSQGQYDVLVKDIQIDPVRRTALHVDFWQVPASSPVVVNVPLKRVGRSKAVQLGAKMETVLRDLKIKVPANKIPAAIEIDVTELGKGAFRAGSVVLPEGCELAVDARTTILTVSTPRGKKAGE